VSVFEEGMVKSTSTEILSQYNMQPIHVRSRAEQWELARSEIQLTTKLGEGKLFGVCDGVCVRVRVRVCVCARVGVLM
jgi:hypothetical protein